MIRVLMVTNYPVAELDGTVRSTTPIDRGLVAHFPWPAEVRLIARQASDEERVRCTHTLRASSVVLLDGRGDASTAWVVSGGHSLGVLWREIAWCDIVVTKLFTIPGVVACAFAAMRRRPVQVILVGDPSASFALRRDLVRWGPVRHLLARLIHRITNACLARAAVTVFVSERLRLRYAAGHHAAVACENWVTASEINRFRPRVRTKLEAEDMSPVRPRGLRLLFVGRIVVEKGLQVLADGLRRLEPAERALLDLRLVGTGKDLEALRTSFQGCGVPTTFVGYIPAMSDALWEEYLAAGVLVLPSFSEGLPLCVLEAAAFGTPAVASCVGGIPEIIEDGRNGVLLADITPEAIATALRRLLADPLLLRRYARAAYADSARRTFDVEQQRTFASWSSILRPSQA